MKKSMLAVSVMMGLAVVGCANKDVYSGNVYTGDQAKEARSISYGTIVSSREVAIQAPNQGVIGTVGGGAIGGILGSTVGGGSGQAIATAVGAVAGAVAGSVIEQKASQVDSLELVIKKDDGKEIVVVQKYDSTLVPGARVRIVGGSTLNVSAL
ncbi:outer membrane lipoprotein SlyB [Pasteurella testudinis DSM 23072]|uniref:Outer membrane lipoprotein SlyB n=1 Tax=Pasteurella testudinis DSM 23072 TaxID=1122938 RepID=A0A1W1UHF0_9PAST|nr:glycine zipper 2TM domain-containing protein [Pasteurella testudinis]SMB80497.1 outer membrane lipoprotein SlyB [Pasteurella testudinis DSM 23072]SUB51909.1 protein Lpp [Pasteurella testudinis]